MKNLFVLAVLCILTGCKTGKSPLNDYLVQVHNHKNPERYKILIFLPQNSCSSCLSKITDFLNKQESMHKNMGIVIAGHNQPEISSIRNTLIWGKDVLLTDIKYKYLQYNLSDDNGAFWLERKEDGSIQAYSLEASMLAVNLFALRKAMERYN